jgi:hypothetical protein
MSLADDFREAMMVIHEIALELEPTVEHVPWVQQTNEFGRQLVALPFGDTIKRPALVEERYELITVNDVSIETYAKLTFTKPIEPLGVPGRVEPVDPRDVFILPTGRRGLPVHVAGFTDKGTGLPYFNEVYLGKLRER